MDVLIVQSNRQLGTVWQRHLERMGASVMLATSGSDAVDLLEAEVYDVIVLDLVLTEGSALTVADVANFRQPQASVVFVTGHTRNSSRRREVRASSAGAGSDSPCSVMMPATASLQLAAAGRIRGGEFHLRKRRQRLGRHRADGGVDLRDLSPGDQRVRGRGGRRDRGWSSR